MLELNNTVYQFHKNPKLLLGWENIEDIPQVAFYLAKQHGPTPHREKSIAKDPNYAFAYAKYIIKDAWPPGEAIIAKDADFSYLYAKNVIKGAWPPGEAAIAKDPENSFSYATEVIKGPWPPGEPAIDHSEVYSKLYKKFLQSRTKTT